MELVYLTEEKKDEACTEEAGKLRMKEVELVIQKLIT
jgi:hypothetical protein